MKRLLGVIICVAAGALSDRTAYAQTFPKTDPKVCPNVTEIFATYAAFRSTITDRDFLDHVAGNPLSPAQTYSLDLISAGGVGALTGLNSVAYLETTFFRMATRLDQMEQRTRIAAQLSPAGNATVQAATLASAQPFGASSVISRTRGALYNKMASGARAVLNVLKGFTWASLGKSLVKTGKRQLKGPALLTLTASFLTMSGDHPSIIIRENPMALFLMTEDEACTLEKLTGLTDVKPTLLELKDTLNQVLREERADFELVRAIVETKNPRYSFAKDREALLNTRLVPASMKVFEAMEANH